MRHIPTIYLVMAIFALGIFVAGLPAIAGSDADPLAGVFAFIVALPWILALDLIGSDSLTMTMIFAVLGIVFNYLILRWIFVRRTHAAIK